LAVVAATLPKFSLAYGPTGSVGFELASGRETATSTSDLDLLIRAPERISMKVARELLRSMAQGPCRIDVQLETPRGAVSLAEYARGEQAATLEKKRRPSAYFRSMGVGSFIGVRT
jgi:phosphoribosyl-dephospho-CoA transferase